MTKDIIVDDFSQERKTHTTNMSFRHHTFDTGLCQSYGMEEAVLIHHFQHWIAFNKSQKKNFRDGRTWMYQTRRQMMGYLPYWNYDKIKYLCEKLVNLGILITDNFNKNLLDRTLWYAFADEEAFGIVDKNQNNFTKGKSAQSETYFEKSRKNNDLKECLRKGKSAQWKGKSAQCLYKEEDSKDKDSKEEYLSASPSAIRLSHFFFDTLKKLDPSTKKPNPEKWVKDFDTFMRVDKRSEEEIMAVINHMIYLKDLPKGGFNWFLSVQSPDKIRKHYGKIHMSLLHAPSDKSKPTEVINSAENDKPLIRKIEKIFGEKPDMRYMSDSIVFLNEDGASSTYVRAGIKGFRDIVLKKLTKNGYSTEGL